MSLDNFSASWGDWVVFLGSAWNPLKQIPIDSVDIMAPKYWILNLEPWIEPYRESSGCEGGYLVSLIFGGEWGVNRKFFNHEKFPRGRNKVATKCYYLQTYVLVLQYSKNPHLWFKNLTFVTKTKAWRHKKISSRVKCKFDERQISCLTEPQATWLRRRCDVRGVKF